MKLKDEVREMREEIYADYLEGYDTSELKDKYNLSRAKINNHILQKEKELAFIAAKEEMEQVVITTPIGDLKAKQKKELDNILDNMQGNRVVWGELAEQYKLDKGELMDYYLTNFYKANNFMQKKEQLKKEYFSGKTVSEFHQEDESFSMELFEIFDIQAIWEDFRSGMTLEQLCEIWSHKDQSDLTFDNEDMVLGKRYTRTQILNIIINNIIRNR